MIIVHNLVRSRYGLAMIAVRDNEIAAAASGVNLAVVKTVSFGVSGALTGVGRQPVRDVSRQPGRQRLLHPAQRASRC